jgi:hypothetical protein
MKRRDLIVGVGAALVAPAVPAFATPVPISKTISLFTGQGRLARYGIIDKLDVGDVARRLDHMTDWSSNPGRSPWESRSLLKYGDWFYYKFEGELYSVHPSLVHGAVVDENRHVVLGWIITLGKPVQIYPSSDILHLSRGHDGYSERWPFGVSIFETAALEAHTGVEPVLSV